MTGFAYVLERHGIKVHEVEFDYLRAEPRPGAIWTALSGQQSERTNFFELPHEAPIEPRRLPPGYRER